MTLQSSQSTRRLQFLLFSILVTLWGRGNKRPMANKKQNVILGGKDWGGSEPPLICPLQFPFLTSEQLTLVVHLTSMLAKGGLKTEKSRNQSEGEGT